MKIFYFSCIVILLVSCSDKNNERSLVTNNLKYSAYSWHFNPDKDSFEIYLAQYMNIEKDGKYSLMRHDVFMDSPKYFEGVLTDSIRVQIDSTLTTAFDSIYSYTSDSPIIYDGFSYVFDYQMQGSKRKIVHFIPQYSPEQIRKLSTVLDSVIYSKIGKRIDSFSIEDYKSDIRKNIEQLGIRPPKRVAPNVEIKK
jgi:hypothetical protein